jgi:serine/threonine protein kinase
MGRRKNMEQEMEEANQRIVEAESAAIEAHVKVEEYEGICEQLTTLLKDKEDAIQRLQKDANNAIKEKEAAIKERDEARERLKRGPPPGRKFTRYTIQELKAATNNFSEDAVIGEGCYGIVYKGQFHVTPVAIKLLKVNWFEGSSRFQREMDRLSSIKHPRLVMLMGACPDGGFIIYEYMPRGSLEDRLRCKDGTPPLPWFDRMRIAAEICEGLLFMHSIQPEPIVHHDLKPSNILLDNDLGSKISDFGLVRLVSDRSRLQNLTPESDVYRFGILILQLLVGEPTIEPMFKILIESVAAALADDDEEEFKYVLDEDGRWPLEQARQLAEIALECTAESGRVSLPQAMQNLERILDSAKLEPPPKQFLKVPEGFRCPISWNIMEEPYIAEDGHSYELEAIKTWLDQGHDTSPVTLAKLKHHNLVPNRSLRSVIEYWRNKTQFFNRG